MSFQNGEWVLGCDCAKCGRECALLNDQTEGVGAVRPPISGAFHYRCSHCGANNSASPSELERYRFGRRKHQAA